jgi:hypothetical protein
VPPAQLHRLHILALALVQQAWLRSSAPLGRLADQHAAVILKGDHGWQRVAIDCGHNDRLPFAQHLEQRLGASAKHQQPLWRFS